MWGVLLSAPTRGPARPAVPPCVPRVCPAAAMQLRCGGLSAPPVESVRSLPEMSPLRRVFYGWYVVAAVLVVTTAFSGFIFYNLAVLLAAFVAEKGFPVALASSATASFFIAAGIAGVVAGWLVDRIDVRFVISGGATIAALALASAGVL